MTEGWSCTKNSTRMSKSCNDLSGTSTMCVSQYQCVCSLANIKKAKKHLSQTGDHKGLHILESNKTARVMATPPARSQREAAHYLWSCMWKSFQHMQCVKVSVSTSCFNLTVLRLMFSPLVSFSCVPRCFTSPWLPAASPLIFVVPCVSSSCVSSHRFAPALRYDSQQQNWLWVLNLTFRDLSLGLWHTHSETWQQ